MIITNSRYLWSANLRIFGRSVRKELLGQIKVVSAKKTPLTLRGLNLLGRLKVTRTGRTQKPEPREECLVILKKENNFQAQHSFLN